MTGTARNAAKRKGTQALEGMAMAGARKKRGLCSACKGREDCLLEKSGDAPVLQCEEFQACESAPCRAAKRECPPGPGAAVEADEGMETKGLCANCDNRKSCTFPRPPGGVWHCMEYR
jgi:hypothetical protein